MSDQQTAATDEWADFVDEMNASLTSAFERNVDAQTKFVESWLDAMDESVDGAATDDAVEGYVRGYEVWMQAAEESFERASDSFEGEDVSLTEFRDIWLNTANEYFSEVMSTTAFAAMTGQTVENALEFRQEVDENAEETLHTLGFATKGDVSEVGERLVELERRQHAIETKLDRILEAVEE